MSKEYLGDSVYCDFNGAGQFVLTTENGLANDPSNTIYLEPEVLDALIAYAHAVYVDAGRSIDTSEQRITDAAISLASLPIGGASPAAEHSPAKEKP